MNLDYNINCCNISKAKLKKKSFLVLEEKDFMTKLHKK